MFFHNIPVCELNWRLSDEKTNVFVVCERRERLKGRKEENDMESRVKKNTLTGNHFNLSQFSPLQGY